MIITEINGGLGNQLFQYAAGLALATRHQTELKINVQFKEEDTSRDIGLSHFNIELKKATTKDLSSLYPASVFERIIQRILPTSFKKYYKEKEFAYQTSFKQLGSNLYLKGYWQSELYFSSISEQIRAAFTLSPTVFQGAAKFIEEVNTIESVAIHVRKGDYLISPFADYYTNLESSYYNKAIDLLRTRNAHLKLFVFTDDINWVKSNLQLDHSYTIASGTYTQSMYEDFKAMQSCKYHVIANSSFSWWTAWLSDRKDKVVVAPQQWFNKGPKDTQDLLPKTWLTV